MPEKKLKLLFFILLFIHFALFFFTVTNKINFLYYDSANGKGIGADFFATYQAGNNIKHKQSIYIDTEGISTPYSYPYRYLPFPAITIGYALNHFKPFTAYYIWIFCIEASLLFSLFLIKKISKKTETFVIASIPFLISFPYFLEIFLGQMSFFSSFFSFLSILGLIKNSWHIKFFPLAILLKPNNAILFPIFLKKKKIKNLIFTGLVVLILSIVYFIKFPSDLFTFVKDNFTSLFSAGGGNFGFSALFFIIYSKLLHFPFPRIANFIISICVLAYSIFLTIKSKKISTIYLVWITFFFFYYKHVWEHHFTILMPIFAFIIIEHQFLFKTLFKKENLLFIFSFILIFSPSIFVLIGSPKEPDYENKFIVIIYHSIKLIGLILLNIWVLLKEKFLLLFLKKK